MTLNAAIAISTQYAGEKAMNKITVIILVALLLVVSAFLVYLAIPRISIALLARTYDLEIFCKSARFTPQMGSKEAGGFKIAIDLRDVRISKKGAAAKAYDSLGSLISAPFDGSLKYREIKGVVRPRSGRIFIDDLIADGGDIKVSLKGVFFYSEDRADIDMVIQFSKNLIKKIPRELSETVLKGSTDGWQSLSVNIRGSFKSPAIEVTGRLFKLSIKEMSGS